MLSTVVSLKKENDNIIECDLDYTQDASDATTEPTVANI